MSLFSWFQRKQANFEHQVHSACRTLGSSVSRTGLPSERTQARLNRLFEGLSTLSTVKRAYLARAQYDDEGPVQVVLCLRTEQEDQSLVLQVRDVFASLFRRDAHLDILFVNDDRERRLGAVCRPFCARRKVNMRWPLVCHAARTLDKCPLTRLRRNDDDNLHPHRRSWRNGALCRAEGREGYCADRGVWGRG